MKGKIAVPAALLLLLLTLGADADMCKFRSRSFRGECFHNMNCVTICVTEGATGGFCEGKLFRACMCTKNCGDGGGDNGGGSGGGSDGPPSSGGGGGGDGGPPAAELTATTVARRSGGHA